MMLNVEENRLRTFHGKWPSNAVINPTRLAKAGFYYTGYGLEVQCYLCRVRISDWNYGDQAVVRHRMESRDCPFVVALEMMGIESVPAENVAVKSTAHCSIHPPSGSIENNSSILQRSMEPSKEYGTFAQRLLSFKNWPITHIVHPEQLASAGFYYLQYEDLVECAFCGGVLMNWNPGDNPDGAHRLSFPNCDFYMRHDEGDDLLGFVRILPETTTNMTELGIQRHKAPQRPEYSTFEKRLQTFAKWPKNIKQTPEMLAEAGFYYGGYEDQVRCFHCDGGLRNWQPTDDVWVEHAQWFSSCGFVNLVRGPEFIKHCIDNRTFDLSIITGVPEEDNATESSAASVSTSQPSESDSTSVAIADIVETSVASLPMVSQLSESETVEHVVAPLSTVSQSSIPITNAAVEKLLDTAPAKAALEIGLHVGRVKKALKKRMERVGKPYTDVVHLIQDVLHHQVIEEDNRVDNSSSNSPTSELNNLLNQITIQMTTPANKNDTQKSVTRERDLGNEKSDNESDDLMSLREENRRLKEARLCKVCMDHELTIVFLPCGHLATCNNCAPALANCPLCRLEIRAYVRIFLS